MTQKVAYYVAAICFALAAIASFVASNTAIAIAFVALVIVFGILGANSHVKSTL